MKINKSYFFDNPTISITKTCYADGVIMEPHFHNQTAISMVLSGTNHETVNQQTAYSKASNILIKPAGVEHDNLFSKNCTILSLYLKEESHHKLSSNEVLKEWSCVNSTNAFTFLFSLMGAKTEKEYYERLDVFLKYLKMQQDKASDHLPPPWLLDVKKYIECNYVEVIRSKDLAKEFKVHPVYLARVFQKYFGQSIKSYLKILRINASMATIINEEDILAHIALDNGFSDQSHLIRDFKLTTGITPSQFKNILA